MSVPIDDVVDLTRDDEADTGGDVLGPGILGITAGDEAIARALQRKFDREIRAVRCADSSFYDVLQTQRSSIRQFLAKKAQGVEITSVTPNPFAQPGQPLYNRFVEQWQRVENQKIQLVFHGTPEQNINSILKTGLDPARRCGQSLGRGEYFGACAVTSLPYCRMGQKMLVFAILLDKSGATRNNGSVLVIHKSSHQLPLFVVEFSGGCQQLPKFMMKRVSKIVRPMLSLAQGTFIFTSSQEAALRKKRVRSSNVLENMHVKRRRRRKILREV